MRAPHSIIFSYELVFTGLVALRGLRPARAKVLAGPSRPKNLGLERLDGVSIFFPHVFLDVFSEDDDRVIVLLHPALRTLDARLKPFHDALRMKNVFAL